MNKKNIILLALTSFFADISTEMIYPVLPVFLTQVLFAPVFIVGLIEGVAEGTQNAVQGLSGFVADKIKKRKLVALFGYGLSAIAKPFIGLSQIWPQAMIGRFMDRFGSGTRSAPRDALIAGSADESSRGQAFGLEGIGDNLGAVFGPILAIFLLYTLKLDLRHILYLAIIPGLLAFCMMLFVKENALPQKQEVKKIKLHFPKEYWKYLAGIAIFAIGNSSNAFLILRAKAIGIPLESTIFVYMFFNAVAALSSYPAGKIADKFGRKKVLLSALAIFTLTYLGFALSTNWVLISLLFILYGTFQGTFRVIGKTIATDFVPQESRASAVGFYATTIGFSSFIASSVAGLLWTRISPPATFIYGVILASLAFIYFGFIATFKK